MTWLDLRRMLDGCMAQGHGDDEAQFTAADGRIFVIDPNGFRVSQIGLKEKREDKLCCEVPK